MLASLVNCDRSIGCSLPSVGYDLGMVTVKRIALLACCLFLAVCLTPNANAKKAPSAGAEGERGGTFVPVVLTATMIVDGEQQMEGRTPGDGDGVQSSSACHRSVREEELMRKHRSRGPKSKRPPTAKAKKLAKIVDCQEPVPIQLPDIANIVKGQVSKVSTDSDSKTADFSSTTAIPASPLSTKSSYDQDQYTSVATPISAAHTSNRNGPNFSDEDRLTLLTDDERMLVEVMVQDHQGCKQDFARRFGLTINQVKHQAKMIYRLLKISTRYELIFRYAKFFAN